MTQHVRTARNPAAALALLALALLGVAAAATAQAADAEALYERSVRPLLEAKCYECHSAKADEVKGNLKLDSVEAILKGGDNGPAVIAGDVENSFLLRAIRYQEDDYQMPPAGRLDDEQIKLVEDWVKSLEAKANRGQSPLSRPHQQVPRLRSASSAARAAL